MDISTIKDMNVIGGDATNPGTLGDTDYAYQANAPLYASDLNYFAAETTNITHPFANIIYDVNNGNTLSTDDGIYGEIVSAFQTATSLKNFSISISSSGYLSYGITLDVFGKDYEFSESSIAIKAYSATRLATARTITLSNDAGGSVSFNGTSNVTLAASVNRSDYAETAAQLVDQDKAAVNEGDDSTPVYVKEGVPVACTSAAAHSAEILTEGNTAYRVGSSTKPVYFADGIPVACENVAAYSATKLATARTITLSGDASGSVSFNGASNVTLNTSVNRSDYADGAYRLVDEGDSESPIYVGDDSTPVYIEDGIPIKCGSVAAYSATRLATARTITLSGNTTGSASFNGTSNVTITTTTSYATTAGSAETATTADSATTAETADKLSTGTVGSTTTPVYFSSGVPTVASAVPRLYLHRTSLVAYLDSTYPRYYFLWLGTSSSAISSFSSINLEAIVGGIVEYSSAITYYDVHVACTKNDNEEEYAFFWVRWDNSAISFKQMTYQLWSYSTATSVIDEVISI